MHLSHTYTECDHSMQTTVFACVEHYRATCNVSLYIKQIYQFICMTNTAKCKRTEIKSSQSSTKIEQKGFRATRRHLSAHTRLPPDKRTRPALTSTKQAGTRFAYPGWMEG